MSIKSPLASLVDVIRQAVASAQRYGVTLRKNEAATRAVLIDPVLRALGWDIANTSMVEVEKYLNATYVDYALYDENGDVGVVVEGKALGKPLGDGQVPTLLAYAFQHGAADVFLTDGIIWQHYSDFQPGNVAPLKIINLDNDSPVDSAAYLVQRLDAARFWPEAQDIDTIALQLSELGSTVTSLRSELDALKAIRSVVDPGTHISGTTVVNPPGALPKNLVPLENATSVAGKRPQFLLLPTGQLVALRLWKDILVECCKVVMANNAGLQVPMPDAAGRKVALLDKSPPLKGLAHVTVTYLGMPVYIYTNYDAAHCIQNAIHILKCFPTDKLVAKPSVAFA
jgi:predicted type IV restriction endonuclease